MREKAQGNKDDLLRKLKERKTRWEREKKDMVKRLTALESKIEVMQKKDKENVMRIADNSNTVNRVQEMQQKIDRNVTEK